ncbi:MAG: hypothetical protein COA62_10650 [Rhodobiaceae bacterium]|nr:MAG: hypothetical protein COA62_10650 [Rhodobiaceae bacterium]
MTAVKKAKSPAASRGLLPTDATGKFAGQMQILGLESLRRRIGQSWEKHHKTIHLAIDNIISTHLGPQDLATIVGEDHYILIFAHADEKEAKQISFKIAQAVCAALVGEENSQLIKVRTQVGTVQKTDIGDIVFAPLAEPEEISAPPSAEAEPVSIDGPAFKVAVKKVVNSRKNAQKSYEIGFYPIWNMRHEVLVGYAMLPLRRNGLGQTIREHAVLNEGASDTDHQRLDVNLLESKIEMAAELYQNSFTSLLLTQIHYRTLSSAAGREEVMNTVREIPTFLQKTLMVEIVGIPDNTPPSIVTQRAGSLSSFFRALTIRIPRLDYPVEDCVAMKASAVAFSLSPKMKNADLLNGAREMIQKARAEKLMTTFEGVSNFDLVEPLKEAGAVFISGDILGGPYDIPGNMKPLTLRQIRQGETSPT